MPGSDSSHIVEREKDGMEGGSGGGVVAPSSLQVNIDTAWADTAPAALINHFQWTHTNTLTHTGSSREKDHTHYTTQHTEKNTNTLP